MPYNNGIAIAIKKARGIKMSTNLNDQYITHHLIRRRMRWLLLLVVVLCSSLFVASLMEDEIGFKGFMRSSFNDPNNSFTGLVPAQRVNGQGSLTIPTRVAVVLWDEQSKNGNMGIFCHGLDGKLQQDIGPDNCVDCLPKVASESIFL